MALTDGLTAIGDAIRAKDGTSAPIPFIDMPDRILSIPSGESDSGGGDADGIIDRSVTGHLETGATVIEEYALNGCKLLASVSGPNVASIKLQGLNSCLELLSAEFPKLTTIGDYAFQNCKKLTTANFPLLATMGAHGFRGCVALAYVHLPKLTVVGRYGFYDCGSLRVADFPAVTAINDYAFSGNLDSLILRANQAATLSNANAIPSATYVYVPAALVSAYQAATNWVTLAQRVRAIEDYPEITGGAA